ncbi:hypothetical protein C922_05667 [Plasmodium inui San Antonio 1]|uniref:Uncharacterized protein n=1 Tax=Plasmodium inui San Antonio 1 TaxID=1237626 RepID=W7A4C2_9APIC|nr:hypothetical protein C922_05667 [Plasmodium inui San Antonio 1]EUD63954.1 hypothetical protein C922_05667 [Plasmodium inui San Antonio 1]
MSPKKEQEKKSPKKPTTPKNSPTNQHSQKLTEEDLSRMVWIQVSEEGFDSDDRYLPPYTMCLDLENRRRVSAIPTGDLIFPKNFIENNYQKKSETEKTKESIPSVQAKDLPKSG